MALFDDEMKREQGGWLAIENAIDGLGVGVGRQLIEHCLLEVVMISNRSRTSCGWCNHQVGQNILTCRKTHSEKILNFD
jgi:hypothetical protein